MEKLFERFADVLVRKNISTEEEKPLYIYGMTLIATTFTTAVSVLVLSAVFFDIWLGLLYLLMYPLLRVCAGGYHCKTYISCFVVSNIILVIDMLFAKWLMKLPFIQSASLSIFVATVSAVYIICNAPVVNINKVLSKKRRCRNRKRAIVISVIMTIAVVFCVLLSVKLYATLYVSSIAVSVEFTVAILMLIEKIKQKGEKT